VHRRSVVSCTRIPNGVPAAGKYIYFTTDYRTFVSNRFFRRRNVPPPPPPKNPCRIPDIFRDLADPKRFAEAVGVPCRITTPCMIFKLVNGREVVLSEVTEEMCECLREYPPPENTQCLPSWEVEVTLMDYAKHHSAFGMYVYRQAAFVGKRKVYVAPWGPSTPIFQTMKALIALGFLSEDFEIEILKKHNAYDIHDIVATERFGRIYDIAFNFYEVKSGKEPVYHALLIYWVRSDRVARKYALKLWDLHKDITLKIVGIMEKLDDSARATVDAYRNMLALGTTHAPDYWVVKGVPPEKATKELEKHITSVAGREVRDPSSDLSFLLDIILEPKKSKEEKEKGGEDEEE